MRTTTRWASTAAAFALTAIATFAQQPPAGAPPAGAPQTPVPGGRITGPEAGGRQNPPGSFQRVPPLAFPDAPQEYELSGTSYRVVPVVKALVNPWSLTFLPNGDMLVTERPGRLRVVRKGSLEPQAISGVPEVWATGQGGLLEVLAHPRFQENQLLYPDVLEALREGGHDGAVSSAVRRQGVDGGPRPVRGGQLQYRQPALRLEARLCA